MDKSEAQMLKESPTNFEEAKEELMTETKSSFVLGCLQPCGVGTASF